MSGRLIAKSLVVLLPGLDGTGLLFGPLLAPLRDACQSNVEFTVIDYPVDEALSYEQLVEHAVQRLPNDRPYWILAESFGGPLAVLLATRMPEHCLGLVLSASFVRNPHPELAWAQPLTHVLPIHTPAEEIVIRAILGRYRTDELAGLLHRAVRRVSADVIRTRLREVLSVDVSASYARLVVPILCLRATQDWLVPTACIEYLAARNTRSLVRDVRAPHGLLQTQPAYASGLIAQFIATQLTPTH